MNHKIALVMLTLKRAQMYLKYKDRKPHSKLEKNEGLYELTFHIDKNNNFWAQSEKISALLSGLKGFDSVLKSGHQIP